MILKPFRKGADLKFFSNLEDLSFAASGLVTEIAKESFREHGFFTIALSGGQTPARLYDYLALEAEFPWANTYIFWGDERFVPLDAPDSNYKLARDHLLSKVNIPESQIHPMSINSPSLAQAAIDSETQLKETFQQLAYNKSTVDNGQFMPKFDLILLGMGADGHTASIFPGSPVLFERERLVCPIEEPYRPPYVPRLTMTLPVINQARKVIFLVSGQKKQPILQKILTSSKEPKWPASMVSPAGSLYWFIEPPFDDVTAKKILSRERKENR